MSINVSPFLIAELVIFIDITSAPSLFPAGKRLGADVMSMNITNSAIKKGETLIDTAMTLNAMHPDIIVVRHQDSGASNLLSQKVNCSVLNAGDGRREHPTQACVGCSRLPSPAFRTEQFTFCERRFDAPLS